MFIIVNLIVLKEIRKVQIHVENLILKVLLNILGGEQSIPGQHL